MKYKYSPLLRYAFAIFILLFVWWIASLWLQKPALPPPHIAFGALVQAFQHDLLTHTWFSLYRVAISLLIATIVAVPLGLFLGKNPRWDDRVSPILYITYPIPKVVFLPIFLLLFGIGEAPKIALIFLVVFYQSLVTTRDAARAIEPAYLLSIQSLGATSWDTYRHVYFPATLPAILTSLRIGIGTAMAVLFLSETFATMKGLGYMMMDAQARVAYGDLYAAIIVMGSIGFFLYVLLDVIERRVCPWQHRGSLLARK